MNSSGIMEKQSLKGTHHNRQEGPSPSGVIIAAGTVEEALPHLGRDASTIVMRKVIVPAGGSTGWHYHPGPLLVVVSSGTLTHTFADLSRQVVTRGLCVVEPGGPGNVHIGDNREATPLVMHAVYFLPLNSPLSVPVPPPQAAWRAPT
ncbi:cupin domain-containing protein [Actinomadura sp. KC06]|uniref:cupin domain-containing protein n=1 Tax=Actinomadura sp. KC06 TaxID=2530369 RepID=UPI0010506A08|nr:cupin domain-containing protein [Actinomadura sp. KC06]TDD28031.1 cupin domain-containing protein [Actinomadura sp. KC06]